MKFLPYYIVHTFINSIKKLFKTWVAIFLVILLGFGLIGGIIGFTVGSVVEDDTAYEETIDKTEEDIALTPEETMEMHSFIRGVIAIITLTVILLSIYGGDKSGAKIFTMPDVNFLFASPLRPQSVLMFRMILQMGITVASSLYILFQIPNLVINVGLSIITCLCILIAYAYLLYYSRLASVFTYTVTATNEKLRKYIRPFVIAVFIIIFALYLGVVYIGEMEYFEAVLYICSFEFIEFIPLFGWLSGLIMASVSGSLLKFFIYLALNIILVIVLTAIIWKIKADFYEDALTGAIKTQEVLEAAKTGRQQRKKERSAILKRNNEFKGEGALLFFEKTLYNRLRFAKFGIFTPTAITYFLICIALTAGLKFVFEFESILPIGFTMLVMIFFRNFGNPLADEMALDFIFTVPESPYKKIWFSMLGGLCETTLDLLPVFVITAVTLPDTAVDLVIWLLLWISLDIFCSSVGLFTEFIIPSSVVPSIKAMFAVFIRMFAIVPGLITVIISAAANMPLLLILVMILNIGISAILSSVSPIFLHSGKK